MTPDVDEQAMLEALGRVRAAVLTRPDLAAALSAEREGAGFAARLAAVAETLGVRLTAEAVEALLALPPIGPRALPLLLTSCAGAAPPGWRPVSVDLMTLQVEWAHLGDARADGGFYYDEAQRAQRRPFNRLFRFATPLGELTEPTPPDALSPTGIIFHMSFCGSTLVSRMLAALPAHLSLGEPQPLDAALRLCADGGLDVELQARLLRGVAAALGRPRRAETRYFLKLDAWHIGLMPLIRRTFPAAPWIFLYRDPLEVLQAQVRTHGLDPAGLQLRLLGIAWDEAPPGARSYAAALAAMCERALAAACEQHGGLLVNYAELPAAVAVRILPHFGVRPTAADVAAMVALSRYDAKWPAQPFVPDSAAKQAAASLETRAAAEGRLAEAYAALERARLRGSGAA